MKLLDTVRCIPDPKYFPKKPWLIAGKGPSFYRISQIDLDQYNVLTLNHVCLHIQPTLAHFIDWEAYQDCRVQLLSYPDRNKHPLVCMPWYPHVECRLGEDSLGTRLEKDCWLRKKGAYTYNFENIPARFKNPEFSSVRVRYFSAVAAVNLLAKAGVKEIHTIGVDGGKEYAPGFDPANLLRNNRDSFDIQFEEIRKTIKLHKLHYKRLAL